MVQKERSARHKAQKPRQEAQGEAQGEAHGERRRGRPRAYDAKAALIEATEAFWRAGFSGTSLDDLSAATGMARPSLYAAFGDKRALYVSALDRYWQAGYAAMERALGGEGPIEEALMRVYRAALAMYFPAKGTPRGCFAIGTATTEAREDPEIGALLLEGLKTIDEGFAARLKVAKQEGELSRDVDVATLALLASATLHTIAIRARAGAPRAELEDFARKATAVICGSRK